MFNTCEHCRYSGCDKYDYLCERCRYNLTGTVKSGLSFFIPSTVNLRHAEKGTDNVEHPSHYTGGSIECIDAMRETQGVEAVKNFCICNAFKYLWRHGKKNGVEDVKKAAWYLNKFIELEEKKDED